MATDQTGATLLAALADGVLTLTFNRPDVLNAFNDALCTELRDALRRAEREATIRCVVIAGSGRGFSAGQDLGALAGREPRRSIREHLQTTYNDLVLRLRALEKPVIASINGVAAGVGFSLALACDIRIAADSAIFTTGFSRIGLVPDGGMSSLLPLLVGLGRAADLAFTSDRIDAAEAHRLGLVSRIVPAADLAEATGALARQLAAMPTRALGLTKRAFNHAILPDLADWLDYEAHLQEIAGRTRDHTEGVAAFREKRRATFTGE